MHYKVFKKLKGTGPYVMWLTKLNLLREARNWLCLALRNVFQRLSISWWTTYKIDIIVFWTKNWQFSSSFCMHVIVSLSIFHPHSSPISNSIYLHNAYAIFLSYACLEMYIMDSFHNAFRIKENYIFIFWQSTVGLKEDLFKDIFLKT